MSTEWLCRVHPVVFAGTRTANFTDGFTGIRLIYFLRGHNLPGGGFIAGLITAAALSLQYVACGIRWAHVRMLTQFRPLVGAGLLIAGTTGVGSLIFGKPFLTLVVWAFLNYRLLVSLNLPPRSLFDLGVYVTRCRATLLILANMGRLMTIHGPGKEIG